MKKLAALVLTLVLVMALVTPALAAGPQPGKGQGVFTLSGKITALDAATGTVTVEVLAGNKLLKAYKGQSLIIATTTVTRFLAKTGATVQVITFADLKMGDAVSVTGKLASDTWTATRITTGADLVHFK